MIFEVFGFYRKVSENISFLLKNLCMSKKSSIFAPLN